MPVVPPPINIMLKLVFTLLFLALIPSSAFAQTTYTLLAPLAGLTTVTLTQYLEGMVRIVIGLAGILAVIMIVICGIQMIGSPSVSQKSAAKECIWNAIFGLLLAISSWVILNTINEQLLRSDFTLLSLSAPPAVQPPATADAPFPRESGWYFRYREGAGTQIFNSPRWTSPESCLEGLRAAEASGAIIVNTQAGGGSVGCFQIIAPPPGTPPPPPPPPGTPPVAPPVGSGSEIANREFLCGNNSCVNSRPVGINRNACVGAAIATGFQCTNVAGMPQNLLQFVRDLASQSGQNVVLTGGSEAGHRTHFPGVPVFDLGNNSPALNAWIRQNSTQSAASFYPCRYRLTLNGTTFWMTLEGNHWHACQLGQSSYYCRDVDRLNRALPGGFYVNCPR